MSRPHHLHGGLVLLVAAGGMVGTAGRYLLSTALPQQDGWPVGTLVENVLGAFLLGLLLEALVRGGRETRRGTVLRLGLGTGVLGGFTTFSALAIEVERLLADGQWALAAGYAVTSLAAGLLACLVGVLVGARRSS
ncbi:fluoride efflux transporter FluC [Ornithinimicrobium sediminis]|uniref:fluoride efflux transporter FluC n=1 Tax=Ornithinimicrobium sediminis TaxID=2904603 RepID=UPI001E550807|nr:CrcB family protein [Ornithinimicrobium sediminis]